MTKQEKQQVAGIKAALTKAQRRLAKSEANNAALASALARVVTAWQQAPEAMNVVVRDAIAILAPRFPGAFPVPSDTEAADRQALVKALGVVAGETAGLTYAAYNPAR